MKTASEQLQLYSETILKLTATDLISLQTGTKTFQINGDTDNAYFIGYKSGQDKINLLNSVDAVIFPSIHEPFGIVGLEAMACKKVLIASNVNGMKDYLTNVNYINCGISLDTISNALKIFSEMNDYNRTEMGNIAYKSIQRFDWKNIANQYNQLYNLYLN